MKVIQVPAILFIFLIFKKLVSMELKIKEKTMLTAEDLVWAVVSVFGIKHTFYLSINIQSV